LVFCGYISSWPADLFLLGSAPKEDIDADDESSEAGENQFESESESKDGDEEDAELAEEEVINEP